MRSTIFVAVLSLVLLAGCAGILGGPQVVEDECAEEIRGVISCSVTVENTDDSSMTANVTVEIGGPSGEILETSSKRVDLDAGEQKTVDISVAGVSGDLRYGVSAEEVDAE